jgi:hypothetical protein
MKRLTNCEEYCNYKNDLHEYDYSKHSLFNSYDDFSNLILYGPKGIGKYTQSLQIIKKFSASKLKYERKISFEFNKDVYNIMVSDVHIEVDFEMLGCQSKLLWHEIFTRYVDILMSKPNKSGIILCKNFHNVHSELHDIFYSYINGYYHNKCNVKYILLTDNISFICNNILTHFTILSLPKPTKSRYQLVLSKKLKTNHVNNIKNMKSDINDADDHIKLCDILISYIYDIDNFEIIVLRDHLYNLLIYNLDIHTCIWYINEQLSKETTYMKNINNIILKTVSFLKLYNNNYRPIYHLENYLIYLLNIIHEIN